MKRLLLSIFSVASFALGLTAQVAPDMGFESWTTIPFSTKQDPNGWTSLNALSVIGPTAQSVFKETSAVGSGLASAKIVTVYVNGTTIPNPYGGNLDTAGILAVGKINISPPSLQYGYAYASRPATLAFKSKYSPVGNDSAFVLAYMTHYAGSNHRDTVGDGKIGIGVASTSYGVHTLTMNYKTAFLSVLPDSMQIFISSSVYSHDGARIGSTFYIDSLAWAGYVGINEIDGNAGTVSIYPNPTSNKISIKCSVSVKSVEITDISGRKVGYYPMTNNEVSIETNTYTPGLYLYNIIDNDKKVINRGKFEVAR